MRHFQENAIGQGKPWELSHPAVALAAWVLLILGLGSGMGIFFGPDDWFRALAKPTWNPPAWLFAPVWTTLYVLMAISVWNFRRLSMAGSAERITAMRLFWVQLVLNLLWTPVFFGLHSPLLAFIVISSLWLSVLLTILAFGKVSTLSGYLMVPYLAWISFALVLNGTIWLLNT